jgi:hypothetical protein
MIRANSVRVTPAADPNGTPWKPYSYRGTGKDTLTAWMDELPRTRKSPYGRPGGRPRTVTCGTTSAHRRHLRNGEKPCEDCLAASRDAWHRRSEGENATRRSRYRDARDDGLSVDEARLISRRRAAA